MECKNYITKVTCFNCREQQRIKIPKGVCVTDFLCPRCGTRQLVSDYVTWAEAGRTQTYL
ncbi:hypothetical protein LCGC14_2058910 [marine sediment metagenome]|uniref:Uncharacterized protein n=1 Tax=marine sediment metagenome TaxID=412755 RepID=A0A0F9H093_9ZZZZ